jgi:hypothetical protein
MVIKVRVSTEYEIDVSHLDPKWVDIEGFAIDMTKQCVSEDIDSNFLDANDLTYEIVGKE